MNTRCNPITPHPQLLNCLFACKKNSARVFNDVLGLHGVDHLAINWVSEQQRLLILSSTPALEFNLFSHRLWRFDSSYSLHWMNKQCLASWQSLYHPDCFHDLLYYKQLKTRYRQGYSLAATFRKQQFVFSYACRQETEIDHLRDDLYKMGIYCANLLQPLLLQCTT